MEITPSWTEPQVVGKGGGGREQPKFDLGT
eukprot:COSAG02_NODE_24479_length_687_cov_0.727891_1_plen_29_part_10